MTNYYNIEESNMIPGILNWLGWELLKLLQTLNYEEQKGMKQAQVC